LQYSLQAASPVTFGYTFTADSMEQSPSEANSHSANEKNSPPFMESEGSLPCSQQSAIGSYPESVFPSTTRSSVWSVPFRFSDQNFVRVSHLPMHGKCSVHLIVIDFILRSLKLMKLLIMYFFPYSRTVRY